MLAAFMSTIDTHMNLAASYFVNDIYRRFLRPEASESEAVRVGRLAGVGFLVIGSLIALFNTSIRGLFEFLLQLVSGAGAVFLFRWFWWRLNAWSELSAMLSSLTVATLLNLSNRHEWIPHRFASWEIMAINVFLSGAVWLAVTFLTRPTEDGVLRRFWDRTRPPGFWGRYRRREETTRGSAGRRWENFFLALVLIYGTLFGLGHVIYGHHAAGVAMCLAALGAFLRIRGSLARV